MIVDVDFVQRLKVGGLFALQVYKVVTGCMLTLFVPQGCLDEEGNSVVCSLQQNYENDGVYHRIALSLNGLSMLSFMVSYAIELRRENWAIEFLDIDNDRPDNSLKAIIRDDPSLDQKMDRLNRIYYQSLVTSAGLYGLNLALMVKILNDDYHSSSTISCFVSFTLLVLAKLYNSLSVAYQSVSNDKMMSAYMSEFVSFNVLDADYLDRHSSSDAHSSDRHSSDDSNDDSFARP